MEEKLENLLSLIKEHPVLFLGVLVLGWWVFPESAAKVHSEGNLLKVEKGIQYRKGPEIQVEVFPFMVQKNMIGTPNETGVSRALYYVTKSELESAKKQYQKNGGCWPSTFSSYKRELLLVGDHKKATQFVKHEGPPSLYGTPEFITLKGHRLTVLSGNEASEIANHVAGSRNAEFFHLISAWK
ncbi:MAG TPA: hypothetical protein PKA63_09800 [Oligoflexia bacterium]|nr:hypothetical protein [Oligoflexia bacterium]HMP48948.1 hypothetical protein [Oligoflexia bacterium]